MDKKVERIISIYNKLINGDVVNKVEEAEKFAVNKRSIQRDMDDIRAYLANDYETNRELIYDRSKKRLCFDRAYQARAYQQ